MGYSNYFNPGISREGVPGSGNPRGGVILTWNFQREE